MQQVFWSETLNPQTSSLELGNPHYQHLIKVLHYPVGKQFWLVDQSQTTFLATISKILATSFEVTLKPQARQMTELPVQVTLACALSKKDKLELITQKATELGVHQLIFFEARYSIMKWKPAVRIKKMARLQEIAQAAAAQSQRLVIPKIIYLNNVTELLDFPADHRLIAYEEAAKQGETAQLVQTLRTLQAQQSIICLFGPEGGFHIEEITQLLHNNYISCGLGPRILRAETAPLYFLSTLSYQIELNKEY